MGNLGRVALSIGAATLIAGCGGAQPPIGAPGVMPQSSTGPPARATAQRLQLAKYYKVLLRFHGRGHGAGQHAYDGANPYGNLVDVNGALYGTTQFGGGGCEGGCGTIYSIGKAGAQTVLYRFTYGGGGGVNPIAGLIDLNGTLYGTTFGNFGDSGGTGGSVYSVTASGTVKALYTFAGGSDGANPWSGVVAAKGSLYGTTTAGGGKTSTCAFAYGCGTVYSMSTSGAEKIVHTFSSANGDGAVPFGGLTNVNGKLYGTTEYGGGYGCSNYGCGVVFSMTTAGEEKVLHSFGSGSDGLAPFSGLIDVKGTLYGTTTGGGKYGQGTVYSITTTGAEKVLYSFTGGSDGAKPYASLIAVQDTLYGTTTEGGGTGCGGNGCGTVYSISTAGAEAVLHSFGGSPDGARPYSGLIDVNGTLYGTTAGGGGDGCRLHNGTGCGAVFALTP